MKGNFTVNTKCTINLVCLVLMTVHCLFKKMCLCFYVSLDLCHLGLTVLLAVQRTV